MNQTTRRCLRRALAAQGSLLLASSALAQVAPEAPPPAPSSPSPAPVSTAPAATKPEEELVVLSPFEVVTNTRGYYSTNTMSGTRFNTKLEDLPSSLSVLTKEQMSDFGMVDINDIFLYMGNTEGTGTFTDFVIDRNGQPADNVQLNPNGANRVRGISAANLSYGNFEISNRMPIDPVLVEGIEVSRGPNANVFGLGNAGGTVNQVPVSANVSRNRTVAEGRMDSYGGYRTALDTNIVLRKNVLAVRASAVRQQEEFQRKPSGINTTRYNAMVKYQPFKYTTISGSIIYYSMEGNRPNFTPPRDNVSYWISQGRPSWNPNTMRYTLNGVESAALTNSSDAGVPDFFYRTSSMSTRSNLYIDQNGIGYWTAPYGTNANTPASTSGNNPQRRLMLSSPGYGITGNNTGGRIGNQPLFSTVPVVSDQGIYDWSRINLSSVNRLRDETRMYLGQIDQIIVNTPMHQLVVQGAALREESERYARTPIGNSGNSGVSGQLFVDVNSHHIDGTVNPYFGRTFIGVTEPRTTESPQRWDTYRGQASYRLDLTQSRGALKWFGTHQVSGYYEYKHRINRAVTYRDVLTSDHTWTTAASTGFAANTARGNQSNVTGGPQAGANIARGFMRYYVGDANGYNVDYAPSDYSYGSYPFHWGNAPTYRVEDASLGLVASTDGAGGNANLQQILKTKGVVIQSTFLDGKLIGTAGLRQDDVYSKNGVTPQLLANGNREYDFENNNRWAPGDHRFATGKTKTFGAVARPFRDLAFVKSAAETGSGPMRLVGQALQGISFTYNQSDTFLPAPPAIDLQLRQLPNITGDGKDYGIWLNMMDGKLVIRVNRYQNKQLNSRDTDANTIAQRVLRMDLNVPVNDTYQLYDQATTWVTAQNPTWTAEQVRNEVASITKMPIARHDALVAAFSAGTIAATSDITAKGTEVEVNYNPNKFWTVAASAEEKTSVNSNTSSSVQEWLDERLPVLTTIVDPRGPDLALGTADDNSLWWNTRYGTGTAQTASQNYDGFVRAPYLLLKEQEGKARPSMRRYAGRVSTSFQLAGITEQKILKKVRVGGAVRWESKGAIGYLGIPDANGIYQKLDVSKPVYDEDHWYFDAFVEYRTKLWNDKVGASFRLNCRNLQESGRLQPIGVFPDGTPHSYRIVDPRIFMLTASFDL